MCFVSSWTADELISCKSGAASETCRFWRQRCKKVNKFVAGDEDGGTKLRLLTCFMLFVMCVE